MFYETQCMELITASIGIGNKLIKNFMNFNKVSFKYCFFVFRYQSFHTNEKNGVIQLITWFQRLKNRIVRG